MNRLDIKIEDSDVKEVYGTKDTVLLCFGPLDEITTPSRECDFGIQLTVDDLQELAEWFGKTLVDIEN